MFSFIIEPQILRNIAHNGSKEQRHRALQSLAFDGTFRHRRHRRTPSPTHLPLASPPPASPTSPASSSAPAFDLAKRLQAHEQRLIYDAHHREVPSGDLVRSEGQAPTNEKSVDEAYNGLGATFDFFWQVFKRDSIDGSGLKLEAVVHFAKEYDNAFWNGEAMIFGDGDGDLFNRFTACLDVIGHELTHGVTQYDGPLTYMGQSGALNESISDVFGSMIKQHAQKQKAHEADWIIGEGLFTKQVHGIGLRSLKAPGTAYDDKVLGKDEQPAHSKDYFETYQDNGGVHINSGIPNHAFFLMATRLGDYSWDKAGRIWYETLRDPHLKAQSGFKDFARLTALWTQKLYGRGSEEHKATLSSWKDVGIDSDV